MELVAVAAVAENGVIGRDGELPWDSIPADKRQYRRLVADAPVVLGRRTFESMRDGLPGARQIVLSRTHGREYPESTVSVVHSIPSAMEELESADQAYVLGGAAVYDATFEDVDRLRISRVPGHYDGDARFPAIDATDWELERTEQREGFTLECWKRRSG